MNDSILDKLNDVLDGTNYEVTFGHNPESMMIELIHGQEIICVGQVTDGQLSGFGLPINKKHHGMAVVVKRAIMEMLAPPKCTYCEQESKYQQDSYNLCQRCADKVNNLILGKPKQVDDDWYTLYESGAKK